MSTELKLGRTSDYWDGVAEGMKHKSPSDETFRMFDNVNKTLEGHAKVHDQMITTMEKGFDKVDKSFESVIKTQKIANGRTSKNELKIAWATGGLAVLSAILLPILAWALYTLVNVEKQITLQDELSTYEFELLE